MNGIALCWLVLTLLRVSSAFHAPEVWNFTNYIENGDPSNPIHIVVTCHRDFEIDYARMENIVVHRQNKAACAASELAVLCFHGLNPHTPPEEARECREVEYPLLRDLFASAPEGAIGFPTQFWESGSWFRASAKWPVAISPMWAQEIFENKFMFNDFMEQMGEAKYIPKLYRKPEDIRYPCIVKLKPITGTNSAGVLLIHDSTEMAKAMELKSRSEAPLIQEAVDSPAEVTAYFAAFRGRLLSVSLCKVSISGGLAIMDNDQRGARFDTDCDNVPGFAHHIRPLIRKLVGKMEIDGLAFANIKLKGVDDVSYFSDNKAHRTSIRGSALDSFVKIIEINARIGGGLYSTPRCLAQFIRVYHLALYCKTNSITMYDHLLYPKVSRV